MVTSKGTMVIALDAVAAPKTVNNFVFLARYHYYDGIVFHRIIPGFVLQGGDPEGTGRGGPGYRFADELPKPGRYQIGSLAMANAGPDTNGSQFFIISGPDGAAPAAQYSLFGAVVSGGDVVPAIEAVGTRSGTPTRAGGHRVGDHRRGRLSQRSLSCVARQRVQAGRGRPAVHEHGHRALGRPAPRPRRVPDQGRALGDPDHRQRPPGPGPPSGAASRRGRPRGVAEVGTTAIPGDQAQADGERAAPGSTIGSVSTMAPAGRPGHHRAGVPRLARRAPRTSGALQHRAQVERRTAARGR